MSAKGEYYDVQKLGDEWVAIYDSEQRLMGERFATEKEAWDFVNRDKLESEDKTHAQDSRDVINGGSL